MTQIKKILIANRGEIACRIMKTCKAMGISTVAVYSDVDKNSLHTKIAQEAIYIGSSPSAESYLNIEKIISAAKKSKADAIHPGYGFLSENSDFAKRCDEEKIIFIGPSSDAIEKMGSKAGAKEIMKNCGVPVVPGYEGEEQSLKKLSSEAEKIGFPVLLKASGGGGGKGMRIVRKKEDLKNSIETAQREAKSAFGNERLIIEKYFDSCRHVEFQIFGDMHGNIIHLFERECTIQRRHQKIIEESPSPVLTPELRGKMAEAAVKAGKAINYSNAGTVEFILVNSPSLSERGLGGEVEFFFLEVNTRLQVEHPVTEAITGLDLVKLQIEVAEGKSIPNLQGFKNLEGLYAMEVRLYAENPANNFLPETGKILLWKPAEVENVRYDSGIETGSEVSIFYDPLLAKIIAKGKDRKEVIRKMIYALQNTVCLGITTNKEFLITILQSENFVNGNYDTHFIHTNLQGFKNPEGLYPNYLIASMLFNWNERQKSRTVLKNIPSGWRNNFYQNQFENYTSDMVSNPVRVEYRPSIDGFETFIGEKKYSVELINPERVLNPFGVSITVLKFTVDGHLQNFYVARNGENIFIHSNESGQIKLKLLPRFPEKKAEEIKGHYKSPMPGEVVKVSVKSGDLVKKGDSLLVLLSMKMENTIAAHSDGTVEEIFVQEKSFVQADSVLLKMKNL